MSRDGVRARLLERARRDPRVSGAALTGSGARGDEDAWSDVDLFLSVAGEVDEVLADYTGYLYDELGALHHFDLFAHPARYRAFLLADRLEVDLGLTPAAEFRSHGGAPFRVVFGEPAPPTPAAAADPDHLVGLVWHHVLHARSSIERDRPWQAEHWISLVRDHLLTLAALRHGHPNPYAGGADRLPAEVTGPLRRALVHDLDRGELDRALREVTTAAVVELRRTDPGAADRLGPALRAAAGLPPT